MIVKFKTFESISPIDPLGEEDWDDTNLYNKPVKILEIGITNGKYYEVMLCKAIASKENDEWGNSLMFKYIKEYPDSGTVPVGSYVIYWGVYYIIVDDVNNIEQYVNEMKKLIDSGGGRWCFVFDKDASNDIILKYAKLLYPNEKVKIVKQN